MSNLGIFPNSITPEEQFLLSAYSRLKSAQDALKKVKEFKKVELNSQKLHKPHLNTKNLSKNANSNTDKVKQLLAAGKLDLGNNNSKSSLVNSDGFRRRRPQKNNNPNKSTVKKFDHDNNEENHSDKEAKQSVVAHERIKIFAGPGITEDKISQVFAEFGRIKNIKLLGHGTTIDTALVNYEETESAVEAVKKMHNVDHDDFVAKLKVNFTRKQSDTVKNVFNVNRKPKIEDPSAHGRQLVQYDEETDLFD